MDKKNYTPYKTCERVQKIENIENIYFPSFSSKRTHPNIKLNEVKDESNIK